MYQGTWPDGLLLDGSSEARTNIRFNATTSRLLGFMFYTGTNPLDFSSGFMAESQELSCTPSTTMYTVNVDFLNSAQNIRISTGPARVLADPGKGVPIRKCAKIGIGCSNTTETFVGDVIVWPQSTFDWISDMNNLALVDAALGALAGIYTIGAFQTEHSPSFNMTSSINGTNQNVEVFVGQYQDYLGPDNHRGVFVQGGAYFLLHLVVVVIYNRLTYRCPKWYCCRRNPYQRQPLQFQLY